MKAHQKSSNIWFLISSIFLLGCISLFQNCSDQTQIPAEQSSSSTYDALVMSPENSTVNIGQVIQFTATGGKLPYRYSIVSGSANLNQFTGEFTATLPNPAIIVRVTDDRGVTDESTVTVSEPAFTNPVISPTSKVITVGEALTMTVSGGEPPLVFSVVSGPAAINTTTGLLNSTGAGDVVVRVTDKRGLYDEANITVTAGLAASINPNTAVWTEDTVTITPTGGSGTYTYAVKSGSQGTLAANVYKAPATITGATEVHRVVISDTSSTPQTAEVAITVKARPKGTHIFTAATDTFVVPAGVKRITIKAWGGGGGGSYNDDGSLTTNGGGGGGFAKSVIAVVPTQSFSVFVGGGGGVGSPAGHSGGGGGGGASAVTRGTKVILVAGGGGGGGGDTSEQFGGSGGAEDGKAGGIGSSNCTPAQGGTQNAPGNGAICSRGNGKPGVKSDGGDGGPNIDTDNGAGGAGYGAGGRGGYRGDDFGGGGGGGGYYGGGGGGSGASGRGSSGGGGSNYVNTSGATGIESLRGSGRNAANPTDPDYVSGSGQGGLTGSAGTKGRVIISY